jgi:hypothetical protein
MAAKIKPNIPKLKVIKVSDRGQIETFYERGNGAAGALPSKAGKSSWADNSLWRKA